MPRCVIPAIRLSADVGGTFTDVAAFDETTGALRLGKTLTTPQRLVTGIENGVGKAGSQLLGGAAVPARHHGRDQHHPGAQRREMRAADHAGLPRHLRDRPRQPAGVLQSVLPEAHAADRPRPALRDHGADGRAGHGADPARRGAGAGRWRGTRSTQGVQAIAILFLHSYRNPAHEQRAKAIVEQRIPGPVRHRSHELSQEYREYERTSTAAANAYVGPRVQRYLTEMEAHLGDAGFAGNFLIVQSTGGLFDVDDARQSCIRMLESGPAAGVVGTKALCDSINIPERHRLRHGRHHRQGRRDLRGQRADDRRGADRRLCHRPAGADADDRHPGGRHRRRQHRPRRGRQRVARRPGKRRRRAGPGLLRPRRHRADHHRRQPGARPARRRPLPRRRDEARSRRGARTRSTEKIADAARPRSRSKPPKASCASPPPRWPMWCAG